MNLTEWANGRSYTKAWTRGAPDAEFRGYIRDDSQPAIECPNGNIIVHPATLVTTQKPVPDPDEVDTFNCAWSCAGDVLGPAAKYGWVWNDDATGIADLGIRFADDPSPTARRIAHAGKTFAEWLQTAQLDGDETPYEKRKAWVDGKRKPTKGPRKAKGAKP